MQVHTRSAWHRLYTEVGFASLISSEIKFQDESCTNHSLVDWTACLGPDLNPGLWRGKQVLIPLGHPTEKFILKNLIFDKIGYNYTSTFDLIMTS